jgi:hypothetical protein
MKQIGIKLTTAFFAIVAAVGTCSTSANTSENLRDINEELLTSVNLIKDKRYAEACVKLKLLPTLKNKDTDPVERQLQLNIFYMQGQCFAGLGLYGEAKKFFLEVTERDPEQARPYLDLAMIYQYLGEFEQAEMTYQRVLLLDTLTDETRTKIINMRNVNPQNLSYGLELIAGGLMDDNLKNSPSSNSVVIYGQDFVLGDNLRPSEAQGLFLGINGAVDKLLSNDNRLSAQINISSSTYAEKSAGNTIVMDLLGGYQMKVGESEYAIEPRFASISLGGEVLLNITSAAFRYTTFVSNQLRISPILEYANYSYTSDTERSATIWRPQLLFTYTYSPDLIIDGMWVSGSAAADNDVNSYTSTTYEIGAKYRFSNNIILSAEVSSVSVTYDAVWEAFEKTREDSRTNFNINASYNLRGFGLERFTLDVGMNSFQNSSNVGLYEYDRSQYYTYFKYVVF